MVRDGGGSAALPLTLAILAVLLCVGTLWIRGRPGLMVLAAGLFTGLVALAAGLNTEWVSGLDVSVADWFDARRTPRREVDASGVFGYLGRPVHVLMPAVGVGALLSLRARSAAPVLCITGGVGVGVVVEAAFKAVVGRTVTTGPLVDYLHSYPSGHVTGAAALLGTIAVCLGVGRGAAIRAAAALLAVAGVLAVAVLALYTGAHTFSDVVGGALLGGSIVAAAAAVVGCRSAA